MITASRRIEITDILRTAAIMTAAFMMIGPAFADDADSVTANSISGGYLWRVAHSGLRRMPSDSTVNVRSPVTLGKGSTSTPQVAKQVLAEHFPCSAIALTLFDPPALGDGSWRIFFNGAPTTRTATLIADGAERKQIADSIIELGGVPWDPDRPMHVTVTVTSHPLGADVAASRVKCEVVDAATGIPLQALEPAIDFVWGTSGARLLSISKEN